MKKKMTLPLLALCIANSTVLACINNKSVTCHAATLGTNFQCSDGAIVKQNATTAGTIYMAYGGAASGLDDRVGQWSDVVSIPVAG